MNEKYKDLISLVPLSNEWTIDWDRIMKSNLAQWLRRMSETPQNPQWHGEGDVLTHTRMVCERLIELSAWQELERHEQEELFIAALLHDIGKPSCTREENGQLVAFNHASVGERIARTLLWWDFDLSGTPDEQQFREIICVLIRHHMQPLNFCDEKSPERKAIQLAAYGELAGHFSNALLSILAQADIMGRIAGDIPEKLSHLEFFREVAENAGCLDKPLLFPSAFSRYAYLSGRNILPGQDLYDDTWGTVILLSGLPGTGKDTYIDKYYPDLPVVSLDVLRKEMNISPTGQQGKIVSAAQEQAKAYLRNKQPFIWNATNVTAGTRQKQIRMLSDYNASVRVIYFETAWGEMLCRNQSRCDVVPESAIRNMLEKLVLPALHEAHEVEWIIT